MAYVVELKEQLGTKLKILEALYSSTLGGSEMLGVSLAQSFRERGHSCDILTTFTGDESLHLELADSSIAVHSAELRGRSIPRRLLVPVYLYRLFKRQQYDVIHCHHMTVFFHCLRPAHLAGVGKIIVTEHAHQHFAGNHKLVRRSKRLGPKADLVTVIHERLYDFFLEELGIPDHILELIPNGIDTHTYSPGSPSIEVANRISAKNWDMVFGSVCRLHKDKDIPNLLHAFALTQSKSDLDLGLVIVGEGPEREKIENCAVDLGISDRVLLTGLQTNITDWLRGLDVFVLPSRREGVPLAILEAMSCGVPVVATDVGGVSHVVDRSAGVIVPRENHEELAQAMTELTRNPELKSQLAVNSRKLVEMKFSHEVMIDRYLAAFVDKASD